MATSTLCPKCGSSAVRLSRRRLKDGVLHLLFYSALRCHACGHRYFRISGASLAIPIAVLLLLAFLIGIGEIVWMHYQ
jgi:C4-type Zn-finger protein